MTRRSTALHHRHSRSIPGMRRCQTCGTLYTRHAMICPRCHGYGPLNALAPAPGRPTELAPGEFIIAMAPPARSHTHTHTYPAWVPAVSLEITRRGYDTSKLSGVLDRMIDDRAPASVRDVVRAVLYYRYGEPLPALDPHAETEAIRWLGQSTI